MMRTTIILLVLPALAYGRITVQIEASSAKNETSVVFNGTDSAVISDIEQESFYLTPSVLKAAVSAHAGGSPLNIFVKSPTPWGDLYKTYKWTEVTRNTQIKEAKIFKVNTEIVTLAQRLYKNKASREIVASGEMKSEVENTVNNTFTGKNLSVNAEYNVGLVVGLNPLMHLKLVSHLGRNGSVKDAKEIQAAIKFTLKPSQAAEFLVNATKVKMDVLINYETTLNGEVAVNYNPKYRGHHFWAYDVKKVMKSVKNMSSVEKSVDLVTIEYYTDAFGYVIDMNTGKVITSVPAYYVL